MFGKTKFSESEYEELKKTAWKEKERNIDLERIIMRLLEHEYLIFNVRTNSNDQLVMTIDQYNSLKPSVQKRLRKLDLVTVPIDKNTDYLKLLKDIQR